MTSAPYYLKPKAAPHATTFVPNRERAHDVVRDLSVPHLRNGRWRVAPHSWRRHRKHTKLGGSTTS